ncbi:gastrula zinc finger protein XlCGF57.1-like protein [Leptotrombidium deliense]|uniref:Gastrula zinc finger protein XlCGF57.1-like protein n=1 Tax=Leptotrombidium deliense TaxID=299467 RepID=A0A443SAJ9_9ACAR|nr:gastrula zinc finger protein XlCGF57.1-like protein [Leptotrombidium deliense]
MDDGEELIVPNSPLWFETEDDGKDSDVEILECRESLPKEPESKPEPLISLIDSKKLFDDFYAKVLKQPESTVRQQTSKPLKTYSRPQRSPAISNCSLLKSESMMNASPQTKLNLILQHQLSTTLASTSNSNGVVINKPVSVGVERSSLASVINNCDNKTTANLSNCVANRFCDKVQIPKLAPVVEKPSFPCKCGKKFELLLDLEDHIKDKHMNDVRVNLRHLNETQVDDAVNGDSRFVDDAVQKADLKLLISMDHVFKPPADKVKATSSVPVCVVPNNDFVKESETLSIITIDNESNFDTTFVAASDFTVHVDCIEKNIAGVYTGLDPLTVKMKYECYFCSLLYTRLKLLRKHAKEVHGVFFTPYINFYCAVCDEVMNYAMYRTHLQKKHRKRVPKSSQPTASYFCELCEEDFPSVEKLDSHRDSKHKESFLYRCVLCGVSFEKEFDLENHCLEHTCNQVFRCNICGEMFPEITVFKNHVRSHEKNYVQNYVHCSVCNQLFKTQTDLDDHIATMREADLPHYLYRS